MRPCPTALLSPHIPTCDHPSLFDYFDSVKRHKAQLLSLSLNKFSDSSFRSSISFFFPLLRLRLRKEEIKQGIVSLQIQFFSSQIHHPACISTAFPFKITQERALLAFVAFSCDFGCLLSLIWCVERLSCCFSVLNRFCLRLFRCVRSKRWVSAFLSDFWRFLVRDLVVIC